MSKKIFLASVGGEPSGFVVAAVCAALALISVLFVAADLPKLHSFSDIATPSALAMLFGFIGACVAVITSHALDRDRDSHSQL